jgi:hypothetical protein
MNTKFLKTEINTANKNTIQDGNVEYEPLKTDRDTERQFNENIGV